MKFIQREHIDIEKWDALVKSDPNVAVFSLSSYLDAVAENWCIYTDDDYSKGIALPFTVRLGVKTCYTPIFLRYVEWIGDQSPQFQDLIKVLKTSFAVGQLSVKQQIPDETAEEYVFQLIESKTERTINSQAKRMLTKAMKNELHVTSSAETRGIQQIIAAELPQKIQSINTVSLSTLERLIANLRAEKLLEIRTIEKEGKLLGGLYLVNFNGYKLYLKGAFEKEAKDVGAMYFVMKEAILQAEKDKLIFDFGGSRVEGVRRFNVNLGGNDRVYYSYQWNNAAFWFNLLKKIRKGWKRK